MSSPRAEGASALPSRFDRLVPWIAGLVVALPVLVARYPPMADLPAHEAVVGLLRHWGDARFVPPNVYALNLGQPNQLLYFFILPLAYVMPTATAAKLVVAATILFLPVAAARFADHLRVTRWTALLVAPLGLGWMFFWGLLANMMGLVAYLFVLPALDRFVSAPTARRFGGVVAAIVFLHFVHDVMALAAGVTLVVLTLCAWRGWRANVARIAPAGVVAALVLLSRALEWRVAGQRREEIVIMASLASRVRGVPGALFAGDAWTSGGLFVLASLALALFALERSRLGPSEESPSVVSRAQARRFEITALVFVALYFVAPLHLGWTTQIYQRFLSVAWCLLAVSVAARGDAPSAWRLPRMMAGVLPIAPVLLLWPELAASDRAFRDLDALIPHMEPCSSYALLELGPNEDPLFSPVTSGGHIVASLGGRALFDYTRSPASPVVQRREARWDESYERIDHHTYRFVPAHDLRLFRYVILHTSNAELGELVRLSLEPDARTLFRQGEFALLESTLPRVPLDAPDDPFVGPQSPTLDERALATAKRLGLLNAPPSE